MVLMGLNSVLCALTCGCCVVVVATQVLNQRMLADEATQRANNLELEIRNLKDEFTEVLMENNKFRSREQELEADLKERVGELISEVEVER